MTSILLAAQNQVTAQTNKGTGLFQFTANDKPVRFYEGKAEAFAIKEDGSLTILAQTTLDIFNTRSLALYIEPVAGGKKI